MNSRDFCYWLQGFIEISEAEVLNPVKGLTRDQVNCIKKHLAMVFAHEIDPSMGGDTHQHMLNEIHNNKPSQAFSPAGTNINDKPSGMRC